jgi:DNA-binding NarL/FixJ family response regulator
MKPAKAVRILLVDDTPLVLKTVQQLLARESGIEVVGTATNGTDAIDLARRLKPDMVILDLNMPGLNGVDTAREIKQKPDAPRVAVFSFEDSVEWRKAAEETGVDAWCDKRGSVTDLVNTVRRLFPVTSSNSGSVA